MCHRKKILALLVAAACACGCARELDLRTDAGDDSGDCAESDSDSCTDLYTDVDAGTCEPYLEEHTCVLDDIDCYCQDNPFECEEETFENAVFEAEEDDSSDGDTLVYRCQGGHSMMHSFWEHASSRYYYRCTTGELIGFFKQVFDPAPIPEHQFECEGELHDSLRVGFTDCEIECVVAPTGHSYSDTTPLCDVCD